MDTFLAPYRSCPICEFSRIAFSLVVHYWREFPLTFFQCENCRAIFANPMPNSRLITDGNNALVRWYQQDRSFEHEFNDARQAYLRGKLLAYRLKRWKPKGTLLDLGCYNGFLLLGVRDHCDWDVEGLEISDALSTFIRQKLGIECHNGTLEELKLAENNYDFILCHDLIEHINQPKMFLDEIKRILKPGGRIQVITPNAIQDLAFAKRAYLAGTPPTMLLNHILNFSPRALKIALEGAGLKIRRLYSYDIRHVFKDFGLFGLGRPDGIRQGASMKEAMQLDRRDLLSQWNESKIQELRAHPKVSYFYGLIREILPNLVTIPVPDWVGIGHEIYALAEKPVKRG